MYVIQSATRLLLLVQRLSRCSYKKTASASKDGAKRSFSKIFGGFMRKFFNQFYCASKVLSLAFHAIFTRKLFHAS